MCYCVVFSGLAILQTVPSNSNPHLRLINLNKKINKKFNDIHSGGSFLIRGAVFLDSPKVADEGGGKVADEDEASDEDPGDPRRSIVQYSVV